MHSSTLTTLAQAFVGCPALGGYPFSLWIGSTDCAASMALLLIVACLLAAHAEHCHPSAIRSNGTLNSAPLLLQRPGALVSTAPKNRSWENATASASARSLSFPQILATETWSFIAEGKVRTVSLEGFGPAGVHKFLNAAFIFDWCLFVVAACVAFVWRRSSRLLTPLASLMGWFGLGSIYAAIIFARMGSHHGSNWVAGRLGQELAWSWGNRGPHPQAFDATMSQRC